MIYSMTGFASKSIILELDLHTKAKLTLSLKSLNSRYFDITCKLPYILNQFETDFIKLTKSKLHRGHVYLTIYINDQSAFKTSIEPAFSTIAAYIDASEQIKNKLNTPGELTISDILRLPNVFILEEKGIDEPAKEIIFNAVNELIDELINERKKEGASLEVDLNERINLMQQKMDKIEILSKQSLEEHKEKVSKKLHEINENKNNQVTTSPDTQMQTQLQTMYLALDKMDVHEEIVRFKSHLQNITALLKSPAQEKGKQLDFILQELAREINTITSKTQGALVIEQAIGVKVEIEKAREQIQNLV